MVKKILGVLAALAVLAVVVIAVLFFRPDLDREDLAQYAKPPSDFLDLPSGASAHYRIHGAGERTILLIHGSNASLHTWEPWARALSDDFRVVTVDMPGHGLTGSVPSGDYSRAGMVDFLHEFVTALDLGPFVLGGNSMGGGISAAYTLAHPAKVTHLVLVSSGGFPPVESGRERPLAFTLASTPVVRDLLPYFSSRGFAEEGLKNVIVDDSLVTEEMIDRYADLNRYDGNRAAMVKRFSHYGAREETLPARLGGIEVPVLILWGEKDFLIPVEIAHKFDAAIPDSQLIVYENVGHIAMEEVPEKSAADVRAFLAAH